LSICNPHSENSFDQYLQRVNPRRIILAEAPIDERPPIAKNQVDNWAKGYHLNGADQIESEGDQFASTMRTLSPWPALVMLGSGFF